MKGRKILKISLGVLGSLVLFILILFFFFLGPTVKLIAQTIGSRALGSPLSIEKLSISPTKGVIHLTDFTIANQEIFGQSNAVSLASLDIEVDVGSLFSSTVVVHRVDINSPHLVYEQSDISDNISEFVLKVQEFAGIDPNAPPPPPDPKKLEKKRKKKEKKARKKASQPPKIVIVESLSINDVLLSFVSTTDQKLNFGAGFDSFSVSMTNGTVRLDNLYVSNPGRLETENLFHLDEATLEMVPRSIYSSNITINAVDIKNPHIFIEHNPETDTIGEFLKIASGLATKIPTNKPKASATNEVLLAETPEPTAPPPNLALESLILDDLRINLVNTADPKLNMAVGLERLNVALERGNIRLENLYLGNPEGLQTPYLFLLEQLAVQLRPGSHLEDTVVIEDVQVKHPHVTLELHEEENTVSDLLKIAKGYTDRIPTYPLPEFPPAAEPANEPLAAEATTNAPPAELYNLAMDDIQIQLLNTTDTNRPATDPTTLFGIREVAFNFFEGQLGVRDILIPNADDFTTSNLFHLANIDIQIQPDSIHGPQFIIDKIVVDSPTVNLEQTEESGNVAVLQTELMKFTPDPSEIPTLPSAEPDTGAEAAMSTSTNPPVALADQPLILHQLLVTNFAVNLKFPVNTNATEEAWFGLDADKLNPMDAISKLHPTGHAEDEAEEAEVDPESAMTILAFNLLSLEPLKGLLYVNNMRISNPPNFSRRNLIKLDQFRLDLDPDTLQSDTLLIEDILISKPNIRYERQIKTDNIKALQAEIEQAAVRRGEQMGTPVETNQIAAAEASTNQVVATAETESAGQKVIIEHLLVHDGIVRAKLSALPAMPIPLPDIEVNGMGKETGGTSLSDASTEIFNTLYESIIGVVGNATGLAGDTLKGAGALTFDAMGNIFGGIGDGISNVAGGAKEGTQDLVEGVKKKRKKSRGVGGRRRLFR